jgi:hypothetical protein
MNIQRVVQEHAPLFQSTALEVVPQNVESPKAIASPELPTFRRLSLPPKVAELGEPLPPLPPLTSLSPSLPPAQPDPRPIYLSRPKIIYREYLTKKEAWLRAYLAIQPS